MFERLYLEPLPLMLGQREGNACESPTLSLPKIARRHHWLDRFKIAQLKLVLVCKRAMKAAFEACGVHTEAWVELNTIAFETWWVPFWVPLPRTPLHSAMGYSGGTLQGNTAPEKFFSTIFFCTTRRHVSSATSSSASFASDRWWWWPEW